MVNWGNSSVVLATTGGSGSGGAGCGAPHGEKTGEEGGLGASGCDRHGAVGSSHI